MDRGIQAAAAATDFVAVVVANLNDSAVVCAEGNHLTPGAMIMTQADIGVVDLQMILHGMDQMILRGMVQIILRGMDQMILRGMDQMILRGMDQMILRGMVQIILHGMDQIILHGMVQIILRGMDQMILRGMDQMILRGMVFGMMDHIGMAVLLIHQEEKLIGIQIKIIFIVIHHTVFGLVILVARIVSDNEMKMLKQLCD